MRVAAVQLESTVDTERNLATAERLVRDAAAGGAELVTLGALGILVAVLMIRPSGLFSRAQARRV